MNTANFSRNITALGAHFLPSTSGSTYDINLKLNADIPSTSDKQLKYLMENKIKNKELFYGIEILAKNHKANQLLDYKQFGSLMPLFTSIVWLGSKYWSEKNIADVESIKLARKLQPYSIVLPHFSCYRLKLDKLQDFLNLNFSNVFAIRGDVHEENQTYKYSMDLVENVRKLRGDSITIGVAGYPEGHPECSSKENDLDNLVKKVKAGADFIITQICFTPQAVIDFIKNCRTKIIKVPILVGIFVPHNIHMLETVLRVTKVNMPEELLEEYRKQSFLGHDCFTEYAVLKAIEMIDMILSSDVEVYGLQFYTFNNFNNIPKVLNGIKLIKDILRK